MQNFSKHPTNKQKININLKVIFIDIYKQKKNAFYCILLSELFQTK